MNVTLFIIIITSLISILAMNNPALFDKLKFNAWDAKLPSHMYRFFTYALVHAGWVHLLINMFVLYSFGGIVEHYFAYYFPGKSTFNFLLLYIGGVIISILPAFGKHKNDVFYNAVGASGAVAAVVFSSIILFPGGKIIFMFLPVPVPSPLFGILYIAYSAYFAKHGKDNIGHDAHLWGAIFGLVFTIALKPALAGMFLDQIKAMF